MEAIALSTTKREQKSQAFDYLVKSLLYHKFMKQFLRNNRPYSMYQVLDMYVCEALKWKKVYLSSYNHTHGHIRLAADGSIIRRHTQCAKYAYTSCATQSFEVRLRAKVTVLSPLCLPRFHGLSLLSSMIVTRFSQAWRGFCLRLSRNAIGPLCMSSPKTTDQHSSQ